MKKPRFYAGVGSRTTPPNMLALMTSAADQLENEGLILRSGGAEGADTAFDTGVKKPKNKQIIIPWNGFGGLNSNTPGVQAFPYTCNISQALAITKKYHPAWDKLSRTVQTLMARNACQVLGTQLDQPALFVLCWTPGGKAGGGTGQAIRIAHAYGIPVFDLGGMPLGAIDEKINQLLEA